MKRTHLFLIISAALFLCSCEKVMDDRTRPVPDNPRIAWLLNVKITKIPQDGLYYDCVIYNLANPQCNVTLPSKKLYKKDLPYMYKIPGAQLLKRGERHTCIITGRASLDNSSYLVTGGCNVPDFVELDSLGFPLKMSFEKDGFAGVLQFRYD